MRKKVAIFDLDGTLLNTLEDLTDSANFALSQFGFPTRTIAEIKSFVGNGVVKLFERAGVNDSRCIDTFKKHYEKNMYNKTAPYDGILPMLKKIHQKGIKIAVVSNKFDHAVKELCKKYFGELINFSVGENEILGIKKKPAPDSVYIVLKELGIKKEEAVYIGDSEVDIETAKNTGLECISVSWGFKKRDFLLEHGAKIIVDEPKEILKHLN